MFQKQDQKELVNQRYVNYVAERFYTAGSFLATLAIPQNMPTVFRLSLQKFPRWPKRACRTTSRKVKLCESPGKAGGFPFINKKIILLFVAEF